MWSGGAFNSRANRLSEEALSVIENQMNSPATMASATLAPTQTGMVGRAPR
jgi:hypothetical protein